MSSPRASHAAIVLAAGGSIRLGEPKQLLRRDGEPLVHRSVRLALATGPRQLVVVLGGYANEVFRAVGDLPCELIVNPNWEDGLASSLRTGAKALHGHAGPVLILGCDQPALEAAHLERLLEGADAAFSGCAASVHGDRPGIPAVITSAMLRHASALQGDRGFGSMLAALPPSSVWRLPAPELEFDIDQSADKLAAVARGLLDPAATPPAG